MFSKILDKVKSAGAYIAAGACAIGLAVLAIFCINRSETEASESDNGEEEADEDTESEIVDMVVPSTEAANEDLSEPSIDVVVEETPIVIEDTTPVLNETCEEQVTDSIPIIGEAAEPAIYHPMSPEVHAELYGDLNNEQ